MLSVVSFFFSNALRSLQSNELTASALTGAISLKTGQSDLISVLSVLLLDR